ERLRLSKKLRHQSRKIDYGNPTRTSSASEVYSGAAEKLPSSLVPIWQDVCQSMENVLVNPAPSDSPLTRMPIAGSFWSFPSASTWYPPRSRPQMDQMSTDIPQKKVQDAWAILGYAESKLAHLREQFSGTPDGASHADLRSAILEGHGITHTAFNIVGPGKMDSKFGSRLAAMKCEAQQLSMLLDTFKAVIPAPKIGPIPVDAGVD
ncbi:hypothetical protein CYLTODRAFT_415780, partial [Cylindrobasidium torrendii FP15055 ss-10]